MSDCRHMSNGYIRGVLPVLLLGLPVTANGKESATTTDEKKSEVHQATKADSGLIFSDVMNWAHVLGIK
ncbi:MAG: hypothetical protein WD425_09650 [Nitrospirales bacterium]